ncbi:XRE family transcriptional regulator, partial [Xanthomonas perforans]
MGFPWGVRVTLSVNSTPTFARRLQQARLHTGLSQKELGIRAGLDPYVASPRVNQY